MTSDTISDKPPDSSELYMALHIGELKRPSAINWPLGMPEDIKEKLQKAEEYYRKADFKKSLEYLIIGFPVTRSAKNQMPTSYPLCLRTIIVFFTIEP